MNLSFNVSLTDIAVGLETLDGGEDERQEVMDFLLSVDESMADAEFTRNLIYKLADNLSHYSEARGWEKVTILGERQQVKFSNLYKSLSYLDEDKIIALMANAIMVKRERQSVEVSPE